MHGLHGERKKTAWTALWLELMWPLPAYSASLAVFLKEEATKSTNFQQKLPE
jgi:hypothetical protein